MEIFFSREISSGRCILSGDEAAHCIRVLRHREGDLISVIDGDGTLLSCRIISASQQKVETEIISETPDWGSHPYHLHLAVSPTKNNDRYEWFLEKACEIGTDEISPIIGTHSERKIFKISRAEKILVSAAKQSLKGTVPHINEPVTVKEFISGHGISPGQKEDGVLRLIAYCFDDSSCPRRSVKDVLNAYEGNEVIVMIGPEGDFSREEAELAISRGFIPVHLGQSRLRTETAAVTAAEAAYFRWM